MTPHKSPANVVLVDTNDNAIGVEDKLRAHTLGVLHRAVSVFALDADGAVVLQQRALTKYHSGGLWSNAACTHPREGEVLLDAAERCLREELGVTASLKPAFRFRYRAEVPPGLIEYEYDHVFVGSVESTPQPLAAEVQAWRAVSPNAVTNELARNPDEFTVWFRIAWPLYQEWCALDPARADNPFLDGSE
jgi:isopentenyl-diphosphate Delta-isomerase